MHTKCFREYAKTNIACPLCRKSLCDPLTFEKNMDREYFFTKMPAEFKDTTMTVACNDCSFKSRGPFHVMKVKCKKCRSWNTSEI